MAGAAFSPLQRPPRLGAPVAAGSVEAQSSGGRWRCGRCAERGARRARARRERAGQPGVRSSRLHRLASRSPSPNRPGALRENRFCRPGTRGTVGSKIRRKPGKRGARREAATLGECERRARQAGTDQVGAPRLDGAPPRPLTPTPRAPSILSLPETHPLSPRLPAADRESAAAPRPARPTCVSTARRPVPGSAGPTTRSRSCRQCWRGCSWLPAWAMALATCRSPYQRPPVATWM